MEQFYQLMPYVVDLDKPLYRTALGNLFSTGDSEAHKFVIELRRKGQKVDATGDVSAFALYPQYDTMQMEAGTIEDGNVVFVMPPDFYAIPGMFNLRIVLKNDSETVTVFYGEGGMLSGNADNVIDPDGSLPDVPELVSAAKNASEAAADARDAAQTATEAAESVDQKVAEANAELTERVSQLSDDIGDLNSTFTQVKDSSIQNIMTLSKFPVIDFEIGNIAFSSSGLTYTDNQKRIRTPQGRAFPVKRGDVIGLTNYTDARFYSATMTSDGVYHIKSWQTADYAIEFDGLCTVLISNITEVAQSSVYALASLFKYTNNHTLKDQTQQNTETIYQLGYDSFSNFERLSYAEIPFELGDITYSDNVATYVISNKAARTKQGFTVPLKAGDKIGLSSYTDAEFSVYVDKGDGTGFLYGYRQTELTLGYSGNCYIRIKRSDNTDFPSTFMNYVKLLFIQRNKSGIAVLEDVASYHSYVYDRFPIKGINHRGAQYEAPENTMPAFKRSVENGYHFIETDVQFTSDNIPVLLHDITLNRTARNADGTELSSTVAIKDITYTQALSYDFPVVNGTYDPNFAGNKIVTLEEFLIFCNQTGVYPYLELKSETTYTQAQANLLVEMIRHYNMQNSVTWISWSTPFLQMVLEVDRTARVGRARNVDITDGGVSSLQSLNTGYNRVFWLLNINPADIVLTANGINLAKAANQGIEIATVSTKDDMLTIMNGIDNSGYISGCLSNGDVKFEDVIRERALS